MTPPPPPLNVLLVDDEAYFRRFVGEVVRRATPSDLREARDGEEAVALFRVALPDLVLLDINMPRMDGLHTLRALRALSADVPIVMLTAISEEHVVEQCVEAGASFFIRKDLPADQLAAELRHYLGELRPPSAERA